MIISIILVFFIIITGFINKKTESFDDYKKKLKKNFKKLYAPYLFAVILYCVFEKVLLNYPVAKSAGLFIKRLLFVRGRDYFGHFAIWFLPVLFLGKSIYNYVCYRFNKPTIVCVILSVVGYIASVFHDCIDTDLFFPFAWDVALTFIFPLQLGSLLKENITLLERKKIEIGVCIAMFFLVIINYLTGDYLSLYNLIYEHGFLSYIMGNCIAICILLIIYMAYKHFKIKSIERLGSITLEILIAHSLDFAVYPFVRTRSLYLIVARLIVDLLLGIALHFVNDKILYKIHERNCLKEQSD